MHGCVRARVYAHVLHTHLWAGRMGLGICPHPYILWGPDGVSTTLPSCLLPSDSSALLWQGGGGGEASTGAGWVLVPGWSNPIKEAPAGPSSAQQPVTLGLSYLSLSKAGRRDFVVAVFTIARVTHTLLVLSISPEVGKECTLHAHFEPV